MKVRFNIEYSTIYGETLVLNIVNNAENVVAVVCTFDNNTNRKNIVNFG